MKCTTRFPGSILKLGSILSVGSMLSLAALVPSAALAQWRYEDSHQGKAGKVSPDAAAMPAGSKVDVIIQYKHDPGWDADFQVYRAGGLLKGSLPSIKAVAATVPASSLESLASDWNVSYISLDRPLWSRSTATTTAISTIGAEYTTEPINASQVWAMGYVGTGIGVAVIDSGINTVDDLSVVGVSSIVKLAVGSRIVYSASFLPDPTDGSDQFGHGTHVAGLIAGNGVASKGLQYTRTFSGVAPNANLIDLRALDENGGGTDSSVIAAIEAAISLKDTYNIRVINLSLGRPIWENYTQDPLCQAVEQAWKAGIVVVVAAGNSGRNQALNGEGYGTIEAPGNDPYVITVGAMRTMRTAGLQDDRIASYSSKGPSFLDHVSKPDLVAPGNLLPSLKFEHDPLAINNPTFATLNSYYKTKGNTKTSEDYFPLSGTSMATGVTSGAVALLIQSHPDLTPDQVKALLMKNANRSYFPASSSVTDSVSGAVYAAN